MALNLRHYEQDGVFGFVCPVTGEVATNVWSDHGKPGIYNSCVHCTGDTRTPADRLHELSRQREAQYNKKIVAELLQPG